MGRILDPVSNSGSQPLFSSNGSDDTAAIQAVLDAVRVAGGGKIVAKSGEVYIVSSYLVVGSNTTLDLSGCTVRLKAAVSPTNMLRNYAYLHSQTVMDGAITTGTAALACATSLPFGGTVASGTPVLVWGAGPNGSNLSTTVASVTDSGHVTLAANASSTVSGAAVSIGARDSNITVIGGTWDRNAVVGSTPPIGDTIRIQRCDEVTVIDANFVGNTGFHNICFGDCTNFTVTRPKIASTGQVDLVHLNGPLDGGRVENAQGYGASALVSLTPNDYVGSNDTYGWITNVDIDGVHAEAGNTGLLVGVIAGNPGTGAKHIRIRNVSGPSTSSQGTVILGDDTGSANTTGGFIDDITLENIAGLPAGTATGMVTVFGTNIGKVKINGVDANVATLAIPCLVYVGNGTVTGTVVESLSIRNVSIGTLSSTVANIVRVDIATVNSLIVEGVQGGNWGYAVNAHKTTSVINKIVVSNLVNSGRGSILQTESASATVPLIEASNVQMSGGGHLLGDIAGTTEFHAVNVTGSASSASLISLGASAAVTLYAHNCNFQGKSPTGSAGGTVRCKSLGCVVDLSSSFIPKNNGDMAYNTAAGTLPGVGPAICDGTRWQAAANGAVKTGTATLVAGTVTVADTAITANSIIRVSRKTIGGTVGALYVSALTASTSFAITSTNAADTSVVYYEIVAY